MKLFNRTEEKRVPEPMLKRIPIDSLKFAGYQRELKQSKVNKIAKNFMPDIVGIGLVSFRDGEFWCLDAQHRIEAMKNSVIKRLFVRFLRG